MRFIVILIAFLFMLIGFLGELPPGENQNLIIGYLFSIINIIGKHIFIFGIFFLIVSIFMFKIIKLEKKHPKKNHILIILTQTIFMFIIGIFTSFLCLITIAIFQLNSFAYIVNLNPSILGAQTDINAINKTILKQGIVPIVTASEANYYKELQAITYAISGTNTFYGKHVLSSIPSFFVIPTKKIGSVILIDKTLIISDINKKQLEVITPTLTYFFVKSYFQNRPIRHFPKVIIMNPAEYAKFRQEDYKDKAILLRSKILSTKEQISSTSAQIELDEEKINLNKELITSTYAQKNKTYNACIAKGSYDKNGNFIKSNTKDYCLSLVTNLNNLIKNANDEIDSYTKSVSENKNLLKSYQHYEEFFTAQEEIISSLKANIPLEIGLYVPEDDSIKIVIYSNSPRAISDYFETVTHEYLHYASHVKDNKTFQVALFEEGITEYFAKNIIEQNFKTDSSLGYPVFVRIIDQITSVIPESELADYYFSKDQKGLEKALDRIYGDGFYKNNLILFETLQFTSDNKQLLKFANTIMNKIGGENLKEKDILSSSNN